MEIYCTTCCKAKSKDLKPLKAIDRYISERIKSISKKSKIDEVPFFILSGKIGLIKEDAKIMYYDLPLENDRVEEMVKKVVVQLKHYKITKIHFFGVKVDKNPGWKPYYDLIEQACKKTGVEYKLEFIT